MQLKRAVITGVGAVTPLGNDIPTFWRNLLNGVSGAAPITHFDASKFKTQFACEVKNFDPTAHFDKKEVRRIDRFCQFALVAVDEALKRAQLDLTQVNPDRIGVLWGSALGGLETTEEQVSKFVTDDHQPKFSPFYIPKMLIDSSSGLIAIKYGFRGVNYNVVSACASATGALIDAFNLIRLGKADLIVTGGSEAGITPSSIGGFNALNALSTRNGDPQRASRPFDVERDGFVMGEGAGALLLEEYEHAQRRGAPILAEVVGGGVSADAYHVTATHPDGLGAMLSMRSALEEAALEPSQISYINPHATSTPVGDISEVQAMEKLLGEHLAHVNISATKSMTGHLLGAAGAIEAIICVLAVQHDAIPPTINTETVDATMPAAANLTLGQAVQRRVEVAMSNSFGFGGHNATVIVQKP